jgi:hypothetical protein
MTIITYRINGRPASLEANRLYRRLIDDSLMVKIDNGCLRKASPEEAMAVATQLGGMVAVSTAGETTPDFAAMTKTEIEFWAKERHGVNLGRRRKKETLIEEARALAAA